MARDFEGLDLEPELMTYLKSGGEDTSAIEKAFADDPDRQPPPPDSDDDAKPATKAAEQPKGKQSPSQDDDDDRRGWEYGEDGRVQKVPYHALHKTRAQLKERDAEMSTLREQLTRANERLTIYNEAINGGGEKKDGKADKAKSAFDEEPIDPSQDFVAAVDQLRRQQLELREKQDKGAQGQAERDEQNAVAGRWRQEAEAKVRADPNFAAALGHWIMTRDKELAAYGIADKDKRQAIIRREHFDMAKQAYAEKRDPLAMVLSLAEARGFAGQETNGELGDQDGNNSDESSKNADTIKKPSSIDKIKNAKKTSTSLNDAGGSGGSGLTLSSVADMDQDDFNERVGKLGRKGQIAMLEKLYS